MKKVFILGINGFIGHHLTKTILQTTDWQIFGIDLLNDKLKDCLDHPRLHFFEGDIRLNKQWIEHHIELCDVILPLVAIATPAQYIQQTLQVFELDFEENLSIIRLVVQYDKHLVFPSTSEVYGMTTDDTTEFDPIQSQFTYGSIDKSRWIYACSKQLLDRIIYQFGKENQLKFTLFRPFNWIGTGLDSIQSSKQNSSRVVTQFFHNILQSRPIYLVNGGEQTRLFTDIQDGINALIQIIHNQNNIALGKIYNIANTNNSISIRQLAHFICQIVNRNNEIEIVDISSDEYYGIGYQDTLHRLANVEQTEKDLNWKANIDIQTSLTNIFHSLQ